MQTMPLVRPPPSSRDLVFDDGEPLESTRHRDQMILLIHSLQQGWAERTDFYVSGNNFLYDSETQSRKNDFRGPDVYVVLGTTQRERKGWVVWEEDGKAPDVIIELLSASTEHIDRHDKMRLYGRTLKVGEYFLFDPFTSVLEGYTLDAARGEYSRKEPDAQGRVQAEQLGLWLGVVPSTVYGIEAPWLRWQEQDASVLTVGEERARAESARANAESARANAESARANAEAARAARLEREIEELRARLK